MLIDTHAHYEDKRFDTDRESLMHEFKKCGYISKVINASAGINDLDKVVSITQQYDMVYASMGVHPHYAKEMSREVVERVAELATAKKIVAIGEIGLDYYYGKENKELQKKWFVEQIDIARQLKLPIIIHDRDAHEDILKIIKKERSGLVGGVVHCYSGDLDMLQEVLEYDFYISLGGVVTFKNAKNAISAAMQIPLERLVLETDCPYLAPEPHRGDRNDSRYLNIIANKIAELRGIQYEKIASITTENAYNLFPKLSLL